MLGGRGDPAPASDSSSQVSLRDAGQSPTSACLFGKGIRVAKLGDAARGEGWGPRGPCVPVLRRLPCPFRASPPQHTKTETLSHTPRCHTWSPKPVLLNKCLCVLIGLLESCAPLSPITEAVARCTAVGQTRPRDQRGRCWTATSPRSTAARKALAGSWLGFRLLCILEGVGRDSPVGPLAPGSPATQCEQRREAGNPLRRPTLTCPSRFDLMANFKLSKVGAVGQRPPPASAVCSAGHVSVLGAFPVCNRGVRTCGSADRFGERTRGAHGSAAGRHVTTPSY